jgi:hypothetical protein
MIHRVSDEDTLRLFSVTENKTAGARISPRPGVGNLTMTNQGYTKRKNTAGAFVELMVCTERK